MEIIMGWRDDWNKLVRMRLILLKILEAVIWLAEKLRKILK
jgi:hypothetical protein